MNTGYCLYIKEFAWKDLRWTRYLLTPEIVSMSHHCWRYLEFIFRLLADLPKIISVIVTLNFSICVVTFYGNDPLTSIFPLTFSSFYLPNVTSRVSDTMRKGSDSRYSLKALIGINPLYFMVDLTDICIECIMCFDSILSSNPPISLLPFILLHSPRLQGAASLTSVFMTDMHNFMCLYKA